MSVITVTTIFSSVTFALGVTAVKTFALQSV